MSTELNFFIVDGYPKPSREKFDIVGMKLASTLYEEMLQEYLPTATFELGFPSDGVALPQGKELESYAAVLWTGCNLTIYDTQNPSVAAQIEMAKESYAVGVPAFGSCWGVQMAAVAAGGEVAANPAGREMGLGRKIHLTADGRGHPMYGGKPHVFNAFESHEDHVTKVPDDGQVLATSAFSTVQSLAVHHRRGHFWATQYHCEYDLHEVARLTVARAERLTDQGFFQTVAEVEPYVEKLEALALEPGRKDLRWQLAIDDDVLSQRSRQLEFTNWLDHIVLPRLGTTRDEVNG